MKTLWICIIFTTADFSLQQKIAMSPGQERASPLRNGVDNVAYTSEVDTLNNTSPYGIFSFEIKSNFSNTFQSICFIQLRSCEDEHKPHCVCKSKLNSRNYVITLSFTAQSTYSSAELRSVLMYGVQEIFSEVLTLPKIYDLPTFNESAVNIYINDKKVSDYRLCNETTDSIMSTVIFYVSTESSVWLEIIAGNEILSNGSNFAVLSLNTTEQKTITLCQKDYASSIKLSEYECTIRLATRTICQQDEKSPDLQSTTTGVPYEKPDEFKKNQCNDLQSLLAVCITTLVSVLMLIVFQGIACVLVSQTAILIFCIR
ncbi:hypothetical protein Btru_071744 [Bulinus truncatus]|nr:hypothetical protein Btru_071744 [Bulinus truncatus]